jgi:hypothetical protein
MPVRGELLIRGPTSVDLRFCYDEEMCDLFIFFIHLIAMLVRLFDSCGMRFVLADGVGLMLWREGSR